MKAFLVLLLLGYASSEKLDLTYLPPPGSQFSGGRPGDILTPLEYPKESYSTTFRPQSTVSGNGIPNVNDFQATPGINRGILPQTQNTFAISENVPLNPTDQQSQGVPTTTISYAFTQTTTHPPAESFETTISPYSAGADFGNVFPQSTSQPFQGYLNNNNPVLPQNQQRINIYRNEQPTVTSTPGIVSQYPGEKTLPSSGQYFPNKNQYSQQSDRDNAQRLAQLPIRSQYRNETRGKVEDNTSQNINEPSSPANIISRPYPNGSFDRNFNRKIQETSALPINGQPGFRGNQAEYYTESGTDIGKNSRGQVSILPQQDNSNINRPGNFGDGLPLTPNVVTGAAAESSYPDDSTQFTKPGSYDVNNGKNIFQAQGTVRPERPQAQSDRDAVILNYENIITPEGFAYTYDTSNGIHADEKGTAIDGVKAKGSYSYIGDDGKVYTITYTADENGFRPYGDHLPTPPPIPEAIQRIIEKVKKEKEAGITDDGSYKEDLYGYKKYQASRKPEAQIHLNADTDKESNVQENQNGNTFEMPNKNLYNKPAPLTENKYNQKVNYRQGPTSSSFTQYPYQETKQEGANSSETPLNQFSSPQELDSINYEKGGEQPSSVYKRPQNKISFENSQKIRPISYSNKSQLPDIIANVNKNPETISNVHENNEQNINRLPSINLERENEQDITGNRQGPNNAFVGNDRNISKTRRPIRPGLNVFDRDNTSANKENNKYITTSSPITVASYDDEFEDSAGPQHIKETNIPSRYQSINNRPQNENLIKNNKYYEDLPYSKPALGEQFDRNNGLNPQSGTQNNDYQTSKNNTGYQYIPPRNQFEYDSINKFPSQISNEMPQFININNSPQRKTSSPSIFSTPASNLYDNVQEPLSQNRMKTNLVYKGKRPSENIYAIDNNGRPYDDHTFSDVISTIQPTSQSTARPFYESDHQTANKPFNQQYYPATGFNQNRPIQGSNNRNNIGNQFSTGRPVAEVSSSPTTTLRPANYEIPTQRPTASGRLGPNRYTSFPTTILSPTQGSTNEGVYPTVQDQTRYPSTFSTAKPFSPEYTDGITSLPYGSFGSESEAGQPDAVNNSIKYGDRLPSTTYRPKYFLANKNVSQPTEQTILVDMFGRPIDNSKVGNDNDGYVPNVDTEEKIQSVRGQNQPQRNRINQGYVSRPVQAVPTTERAYGEDFSGPKQQQRFDPERGYYY